MKDNVCLLAINFRFAEWMENRRDVTGRWIWILKHIVENWTMKLSRSFSLFKMRKQKSDLPYTMSFWSMLSAKRLIGAAGAVFLSRQGKYPLFIESVKGEGWMLNAKCGVSGERLCLWSGIRLSGLPVPTKRRETDLSLCRRLQSAQSALMWKAWYAQRRTVSGICHFCQQSRWNAAVWKYLSVCNFASIVRFFVDDAGSVAYGAEFVRLIATNILEG